MNPTLVLVLGMGRSGTSALTNVLALCGAHLPNDLLGAHPSNEKGFFEPTEALGINIEFLDAAGSGFGDPTFRVQDEPPPAERVEAFVGRIVEFLEAHRDKSPLVIKEPRITVLTDYWFDAAARDGWDVKVVVAVRHPDEVSASMRPHNGSSTEEAEALWIKYNVLAARASARYPRVFVSYENLIADPRTQVERVARALGLELSFDAEAVLGFLERRLRHHAASGTVPVDPVTSAIFARLARFCLEDTVGADETARLHDDYVDVARVRGRLASQPADST